MTCASCGIGEVKPINQIGQRWGYRTIPDLEILFDVDVPTCSHCGERWVNSTCAKALDAVLERSFRAAVLGKAARAVESLRAMHRQRNIERVLGLSGGYLSKVLGEDREPSPTLVAALMLLADSPDRIQELRSLWAMQTPEPASVRYLFGAGVIANQGTGQQMPAKAPECEVA